MIKSGENGERKIGRGCGIDKFQYGIASLRHYKYSNVLEMVARPLSTFKIYLSEYLIHDKEIKVDDESYCRFII